MKHAVEYSDIVDEYISGEVDIPFDGVEYHLGRSFYLLTLTETQILHFQEKELTWNNLCRRQPSTLCHDYHDDVKYYG